MANQTLAVNVDKHARGDNISHRGDTPDCVAARASQLYDAECALHAAHQSHVDGWIAAASRRLNVAVAQYCAAAGLISLE